jgi:hypothetical protein
LHVEFLVITDLRALSYVFCVYRLYSSLTLSIEVAMPKYNFEAHLLGKIVSRAV